MFDRVILLLGQEGQSWLILLPVDDARITTLDAPQEKASQAADTYVHWDKPYPSVLHWVQHGEHVEHNHDEVE